MYTSSLVKDLNVEGQNMRIVECRGRYAYWLLDREYIPCRIEEEGCHLILWDAIQQYTQIKGFGTNIFLCILEPGRQGGRIILIPQGVKIVLGDLPLSNVKARVVANHWWTVRSCIPVDAIIPVWHAGIGGVYGGDRVKCQDIMPLT